MKPRWTLVLLLLLLPNLPAGADPDTPPVAAASPDALTAEALLQKVDDEMNFFQDRSLTSRVQVIDKDGTEKIREMKVWEKGSKRLVRFTKPPSEAGVALLAADRDTNYVYLPAYKRIRRVAAHVRNQTFMGTDLTQTDMSLIRFGDDYTPEIAGETDAYWELDLTPKPGTDSGYGKLQVRASKDRFSVLRIAYFDKDGNLVKTEERKDWAPFGDGHYMASTVHVTNAAGDHHTILHNTDYRVDQGIPDDFFTERNLKKRTQ